jgi:hypothetical protein
MQPPSYTHVIILRVLFTKWNAHPSGERIFYVQALRQDAKESEKPG